MISSETDKEESILDKIDFIRNKIDTVDQDLYDLSMKRKFLNHQLADLNYQLKHPEESKE